MTETDLDDTDDHRDAERASGEPAAAGVATSPTGQPEVRDPGRRLMVAGTIAIVLSLLIGAGIYAAVSYDGSGQSTQVLVDRTFTRAPQFSLPDLLAPGVQVSLRSLLGRGLVLNFWGSWCGPCRSEMPLLESAYRTSHGDVRFVGIDCDDTRPAAIAFLERVHVTYESLFDPEETVASAYGLYGLPTTVFISADGKMLGRHLGQLDGSTLELALREAFGKGL